MASRLVTADTSVVVPFLAEWHDAHELVVGWMDGVNVLPAHVMYETVATTSRLPGGLALDPGAVVTWLRSHFTDRPLTLGAADVWLPLEAVMTGRLNGGQVYDAIIAATTKVSKAKLLSLDRRAERTYRAIGVDYELLA
ncbi:MAG: PIN domain-containing protein [Marmoricola sp.]